jgi:hypothetical protein
MAKVKITGHASGTGVVTITAPNTSTDRTITLPDDTGTLLDENSSLPAANLTGTVADARISALTASKLTGDLPAISGVNVTNVDAVNSGRKNLIINGGMQVAQRSTAAVTVSNNSNEGYQTIDRMFTIFNSSMGGAVTVQRVDDAPAGISNSLKYVVTSTTTPSGNQYFGLQYKIESQDLQSVGYGTSEAKTMTFSFYMKSSNYTGSVSLAALHHDAGTSYFTATAGTPTTSWVKYSVVIPVNTASVFNKNDNGLGMLLRINLDCSSTNKASSPTGWTSTRSDAVTGDGNFMATSGNQIQLTGLQLELGSVATDFEHRSYGEELALCQRYYYKVLGLMSSQSTRWLSGYQHITLWHPVIMRANPTFSDSGGSSYTLFAEGATDTPSGQATVQVLSKEVSEVFLPSSHAQKGTFVRFASTSKFYEFSAEL